MNLEIGMLVAKRIKLSEIKIGDVLTDKDTGEIIGGSQITEINQTENIVKVKQRVFGWLNGNPNTNLWVMRKS